MEQKIAITLPAGTELQKLTPVVSVSEKASVNPGSEAVSAAKINLDLGGPCSLGGEGTWTHVNASTKR
ncbi:MAG: hypothetical protein LBP81_05740 [Treponema sp.]|nr:hypothetical protein [Treponema sp.]